MLKKLLILTAITVPIINIDLHAQAFTFIRTDPAVVHATITQDSAQQIKSHGLVHNLTNQTIGITINIINRYVTPGWDSIGFCTWRACYAPGFYTVTEDIGPLANDSFYIYFSPLTNPGIGYCTVRMTYQSTMVEQTFQVQADPIGIIQISSVAKDFALNQNYPNPFNPNTKISFAIPKKEAVYLRVYDILGREVKTLINEELAAGEYEYDFEAKNMSSGFYYYSLRAGENVSVKKMVLVK
jgi:type IX secretion system substrate protein